MQLENSFHVPLPVDEAWRVLLDIERTAPCMPGAQLDSAAGDDCTGSIKVKLGPINLTYQGKASITQQDDAAHRAVIDARGKDQRGNGTAAAVITATLVAEGGTTRVDLATDLTITGRPAQFGRGVMTDVGDKMLAQFAERLAAEIGAPAPGTARQQPEQEATPGALASVAATATGAVEEIAASVEQVPGEGPTAKVVKKAAAATKKAAAGATEKVSAPAGADEPVKKSAPAKKTVAAKAAPEKAAPAKKAPAKSSPAKAAAAKPAPAKKAAPAEKLSSAGKAASAGTAAPADVTAPADVAPAFAGARRPSGPPKGPSAPPARPATGAPVRSVPSAGPRPTPSAPAGPAARPAPIDLLEVPAARGPGRYAPAVGAAAAVAAVVLLVRRRRRRR